MHDALKVRRFRVNRQGIWYLQAIMEAYDGIGTVTTVDSREGVVEVSIPESRLEEGDLLLGELLQDPVLR